MISASEKYLPNWHTRSWRCALMLAVLMNLSACSTVLRTETHVAHAWPAELADKTYTLETLQTLETPDQPLDSAQTLQLEQARQLLHAQLQRLGFTAVQAQANLLISLQYAEQSQAVYDIDEVLFAPHSRFWSRGPWGRLGFGGWHTGFYGAHYSMPRYSSPRYSVPRYSVPRYSIPFYAYAGPHLHPSGWLPPAFANKPSSSELPRYFVYAPFFNGPMYVYRESAFPSTARFIKVTIEHNQKKLFEVGVENTSRLESSSSFGSRILPFMLESAFIEFPGVSGSTTIRELKLE